MTVLSIQTCAFELGTMYCGPSLLHHVIVHYFWLELLMQCCLCSLCRLLRVQGRCLEVFWQAGVVVVSSLMHHITCCLHRSVKCSLHNWHHILANAFFLVDILQSSGNFQQSVSQGRRVISSHVSVKFVQTSCHISVPRVSVGRETQVPSKFLKDRKMVPNADPPSIEDVSRLYQLFDQRSFLYLLLQLWFLYVVRQSVI